MRLNEYRRLSKKTGGTSIQRQGDQNRREREKLEFDLGKIYTDASRSASRSYDGTEKRRREDFESMMLDMRSDTFDADGLQIWESSRFSRQEEEWLTMINTMAAKGLKLYVTTQHRLYDPADGSDRSALIDQANKSAYESWMIHLRTKETAAEEALKGRPHGRAPYGMRPIYDSDTGRLDTWLADEEPRYGSTSRAKVIRELFRLLKSGRSLKSVEREFWNKGYLNKSGGKLSRMQLRDMALKVVYIGKRLHDGVMRNGTWDGIVEEEDFWAVQRILRDPTRWNNRTGRAVHPLTAALKCGICNGKTNVSADLYKCKDFGHASIPKKLVDALVIPRMLRWLSRPDIIEQLRAKSGNDPEVAKIRAKIAQARTEREENQTASKKTTSTTAIVMLAEAVERLEKQIIELESVERKLTLPPQLVGLLDGEGSVAERWAESEVSVRREICNIVLTPAYMGQPTIMPNPTPGVGAPIEDRLVWRETLDDAEVNK